MFHTRRHHHISLGGALTLWVSTAAESNLSTGCEAFRCSATEAAVLTIELVCDAVLKVNAVAAADFLKVRRSK